MRGVSLGVLVEEINKTRNKLNTQIKETRRKLNAHAHAVGGELKEITKEYISQKGRLRRE